MKIKFRTYENFFQLFYLLVLSFLLITYFFFNSSVDTTTKLIYIIFFLLGGLKFDFLDGKYLPLFTKRFKNNYFNCINWSIQIFIFFQILLGRNAIYLLKNTLFTKNQDILTNIALVFPLICGIFVFLSLFFSITLPKAKGWGEAIIIVISLVFMYVFEFLYAFNDIAVLFFGKLPNNELLTLASVFFAIIPMVYISLFNQNLPRPEWNKLEKGLYIKLLILFFVLIFLIDSAIWLHPLTTWTVPNLYMFIFSLRSGFGEEFMFRVLIMTILFAALKKYKYGNLYSLLIQALFFGLMHLVNLFSDTSIVATIASTIDAFGIGILFGVLYLLTKNIGFVILIHFLWDFFQSIVTGAGNMSVPGVEGFFISSAVSILCILFSIYLIIKNKDKFLSR